ncbi:transporter family-2 protein [Pseudomonas frederiksbergensis]|uniref:DMT family transporter n=1 Tax=Pseudomonas frederiksbergensis TaxID=104087 RepID=UPI003D1A75ED
MNTLQWSALLLLGVIAGAVVPFQSAINANLSRGLGHPLWATLASLLVSLLVLLPIILALRLPLPSLAFISKAPLWMWAGGVFGVCFVALAVMLLPKLGASGFVVLALTGQVMASMVLDHFGLFGLVERQLTLPRLAGALLVVGGVVLIQLSGPSSKALIAAS